MYDKENSRPSYQKQPQTREKLPLIDTSLESRFDPSLTLSGWNTTETEEKRFFEQLKHKQANKFRAKRVGSCTISRKDIRSLLIVKNSPATHGTVYPALNATKRYDKHPSHRDVLKPRTYLFANYSTDEPLEFDLKQIVLPRHVLNLSKVVRNIPDDKRSVPLTSFIRSVQYECRRSKLPRRKQQFCSKRLINEPPL